MKKQVTDKHYKNLEYINIKRFISWYYQISAVMEFDACNILEIGIGIGISTYILRTLGRNVITLDVDIDLQPNIAGSVCNLPFPSNYFDLILCCLVLEHIPVVNLEPAMKELFRVTSSNAILSIPDVEPQYRLELVLPIIPRIQKSFRRKRLKKLDRNPPNPSHYWELGRFEYDEERFVSLINDSGFNVINHYQLDEHPYHHFFILSK